MGGDGKVHSLLSAARGGHPEQFRWNVGVYCAMLMMGLSLLLPWNIVLNEIPWFQDLYAGSAVGSNIAFYITCANSYPGIPILFLMVAWGNRVSLNARVLGSLLAQVAVMALMPATAPLSYWVPLALMFINGLTVNVLQSSLFGLQAMLPPIMAHAAMAGQGVAGLVASVAQIISLLSSGNETTTAGAYFGFAAGLSALCAAVYVWLIWHPYTEYHIAISARSAEGLARGSGDEEDERAGLIDAPTGKGEEASPAPATLGRGGCSRAMATLAKVWRGALGVFLVYIATFIVFPGVMTAIPYRGGFGPSAAWLGSRGWWPILLLLLFNTFDTMGRVLPAHVPQPREEFLLPATVLRFGLAAWFVACSKSWIASALGADIAAIAAVLVLGMSNGYLTSMTLMYAPSHAADNEKETAGFLLSLSLTLGITVGSQLALVLI
jgi:equilibrative nucleoside transporter 1/2/3